MINDILLGTVYVFSIVLGFDLSAVLLLLVILTKSKAQYLKVILIVILIVITISKANLVSYIDSP